MTKPLFPTIKDYWTGVKMKHDCLSKNRDMFINNNDTWFNKITDNDLCCKHRALYNLIDTL